MAIIVDKDEKRHSIALACRELLLDNGIDNLTISQIAQAVGVGKGTIYEYFANKDEIVFEIIRTFLVEYQGRLRMLVDSDKSTREKLYEFFALFFESEQANRHIRLYKEFLSISLVRGTEEMLKFKQHNRDIFASILNAILEEGVSKGELPEKFRDAASSMIIFNSGLILHRKFDDFDLSGELNRFLDLIFIQGDNR